METTLMIAEKFGLPTAFLAIMIWLFVASAKMHREERKEWREEQNRMQRDTNGVIIEFTKAIMIQK